MANMRVIILLCLFVFYCDVVYSSSDHYDISGLGFNPVKLDRCEVAPKGRLPWILHVRQPDYGWKEHTHRANIALAVNGCWKCTRTEMRQMELQLEVEITKALLRNATQKIHENDLCHYIHALIATKKNPRDFHGIDLVGDLLHRTDEATGESLHPFVALTLCNSYAIQHRHLLRIRRFTRHQDYETRQETELKALALKAFACAATHSSQDPSLNKFQTHMDDAAKCLVGKQQSDGSFGNAYTTALAVQALIAAGNTKHFWNETEAMRYLMVESEIKVNLVKAYYIELALNSRNVTYIKDLYDGPIREPGLPGESKMYYLQYTVKENERPDIYHSVTVKVPSNTSFFYVMNLCAKESEKFNFTYYLNEENLPMIYSVAGIPNDAEENLFWQICRQNDVDHNRHTSKITPFKDSPAKLIPNPDEHIIFWYKDSECLENKI